MKRWFLVGAAAILAAGWTSTGAQTPPAGGKQTDVVIEAQTPPAEDMLMEMGPVADVWMAEEPTGDVLMEVAQAGDPDELMEVAQAGGPAEGGMMGGGPPPAGMMGPGGPPMMQQRIMRMGWGGGGMGGPMMMRMRGRMGMMGGPMMLERARKALGLTDEQVTRIHDLWMAHQKDVIRTGADARIARMELEDVVRQPNPKPEDVKAKLAAVNSTRGQMLEKMVNFRLDMKKVFTPEQQEKIKGMMMGRMMGGWGRGGGGGGGWGWGGGQQWKPKEEPKAEPKK